MYTPASCFPWTHLYSQRIIEIWLSKVGLISSCVPFIYKEFKEKWKTKCRKRGGRRRRKEKRDFWGVDPELRILSCSQRTHFQFPAPTSGNLQLPFYQIQGVFHCPLPSGTSHMGASEGTLHVQIHTQINTYIFKIVNECYLVTT